MGSFFSPCCITLPTVFQACNFAAKEARSRSLLNAFWKANDHLADTFLGYNLFWFYPIVGLFWITGPNFLVVRLFFYFLSIITAVLGYRAVWRASGRPLLSLFAAVIIILIPGMQFRTYMGLLAVANLYFFLEVFALQNSDRSRWFWLIGSGLFLGLTFLVRIDLGILFSTLALGSLVVYPLTDVRSWKRRARFSGLALVVYPTLIVLVHLPVDLFAAQHGFRNEFRSQYVYWISDVASYLKTVSHGPAQALPEATQPTEPKPKPVPSARFQKKVYKLKLTLTTTTGRARDLRSATSFPVPVRELDISHFLSITRLPQEQSSSFFLLSSS